MGDGNNELNEEKRVEDFGYEKDEDGRFIVPLEFPFEYGKETIKEFKIRKPKAKDMRKFPPEPSTNDFLLMLGKLTTSANSCIDEIDPKDVGKLTDFVSAFF